MKDSEICDDPDYYQRNEITEDWSCDDFKAFKDFEYGYVILNYITKSL